ncbi:MAG: hypothetical protein WC527_02295 [Candidatus Margulisiibacteriota bacterium]
MPLTIAGQSIRCGNRNFVAADQLKHEKNGRTFVVRSLVERCDSGAARAVTWRTEPGAVCTSDLITGGLPDPINKLSADHHTPIISEGRPLLLLGSPLEKAWGFEHTFTMIDPRQVNDVSDDLGRTAKLPDVLNLFPEGFGINPETNLILLKILKPGSTPIKSDLYLEVHWEKEEAYVVTKIDREAWPDGVAQIVCGLDPDLLELYKYNFAESWEARYKADFKAASDAYRIEVYEKYTANGESAPEEVESKLRQEVYRFIGKKDVREGDVLVFPKGTVHSLQHGIQVAEILTPHYERGIILPTPQKVTSFGGDWSTDKAFDAMIMRSYESPDFNLVANPFGHQIDDLVSFQMGNYLLRAHRVYMESGGIFNDNTEYYPNLRSYHMLLPISGKLTVSSNIADSLLIGPEHGLIIPASTGEYVVGNPSGDVSIYLKMYLMACSR